MAALTAAILGVTGCYGQTDLATHVGQTSATLTSRGTANSGPVEAYFEYWKTATPASKRQTPIRIIGGGASGPFAQPATDLTNQTEYSFRLCGTDQSTGGRAVCAQTRSFFTGLASVEVYGSTQSPYPDDDWRDINVHVGNGPSGGSPRGRVFSHWTLGHGGPPGDRINFDLGSVTVDNVTCVRVQGNVAAIGYRQVPPFPADASLQNVMHAYVVDGGPAGSGQDRFGAYPAFSAEDPDDCSIPANLELRTLPLHNGEAAVSAVGPVTAAR